MSDFKNCTKNYDRIHPEAIEIHGSIQELKRVWTETK